MTFKPGDLYYHIKREFVVEIIDSKIYANAEGNNYVYVNPTGGQARFGAYIDLLRPLTKLEKALR